MAVAGVEVFEVDGVVFAAFDPAWLGVYADPLGGNQVAPHTPGEALAASGAAAVLDGPEFHNCPGQDLPADNTSYAVSTCSTIRFSQFDAARGVALAGSNAGAGLTISVVGGQAIASAADSPQPGATVAVQLWPPLVVDGAVVADNSGSNATAEQRAALAILGDGRLAFVSGALDMVGFAQVIAGQGATAAGYTDGGGSGVLWLADGQQYGATSPRRVATWLTAAPPGAVGGGGAATTALEAFVGMVLVAAAAGAFYVATRPPPAAGRTARARRTAIAPRAR